MAKKIIEEVKAFEVELVSKVKSAFHTVFTKFGKVAFEDGKAVVSAEQKDLIDELQNMNVVESVNPVQPAPSPTPDQPKTNA